MYSDQKCPFDLSSHNKVLQFLNHSNASPVEDDFLCRMESSPLRSRPVRPQSESDDDSLSRSDCSPTSSQESSTTSFPEEFDFNLTFDTDAGPLIFTSMNEIDAILNKSHLDGRMTSSEELLGRSSPETITSSPQRSRPFLHDSTFTLCSAERFAADCDPPPRNLRSNSVSIVRWDVHGNGSLGRASKKGVRFADMLGLDLESIRYMTPPDHSPIFFTEFRPSQSESMSRVRTPRLSTSNQSNLVSRNFISPTNIIPQIYQKQILLECLYTNEARAYGTIRVHNLAYEKRVFVRVTEDDWTSYRDIQACHSMNSAYDNTDVFNFQISLDQASDVAERPKRLRFAVCLKTISQEYWDNNQDANFVLDVFERH